MDKNCKNCNFKYSYTEKDLEWVRFATICPKCNYSLDSQNAREQYLDILNNGNIVPNTNGKVKEKNGYYAMLPIREGFKIYASATTCLIGI